MPGGKIFNVQISENVTDDFYWEINIPDGLSKIKREILNDKENYSKSELTFDTGILEDVPNYGSFNITCEKLSYSLELVESINAKTFFSMKDCDVDLYNKESYVNGHRAATVSGGFNPVVSERQEITGDSAKIRKFMRWSGQYDVSLLGYVDRIKISWRVQRETAHGQIIEKSCSSNKKVISLPQVGVGVEWKVWSASSEFLGSKNLSDVTFVCDDGTEFPSHRFVLSVASSVFRRMFHPDNSEMKEAKGAKIVIDDIKPEIFKEFLRFLYCGTVEELGAVSKELIIAAEKNDVPLLKEICEKSLVDQVTKENAVEMYCLAEPRVAANLMEKALTTIIKNRTKVFRDAKDVSTFAQQYPDLMFKIVNNS